MAAGDKRYFELDYTDTVQDNDLIALGRGQSADGTLVTSAKSFAKYVGIVPFNGNRNITRAVIGLEGLNVGTSTVNDFLAQVFFPLSAPGGSLTIGTPAREVGSSKAYTLNWGVVRNAQPITGIVVNGQSEVATGNNQTGTLSGNVSSANGVYTFTMTVDDGVSPTQTFTCTLTYYQAYFFGSSATVPAVSADVRALPVNQLTYLGNSFILNTGTTNRIFNIAIPASKSLQSVVDEDAMNFDITSFFTSTTMSVNDAGGAAQSYKLYTMIAAIPYTSNHRFVVTIA